MTPGQELRTLEAELLSQAAQVHAATAAMAAPTHHRLFHEDTYHITAHSNGQFTFHRPDRRTLHPPPLTAPPGLRPPPQATPEATDGGATFDLTLAIDCLVGPPASVTSRSVQLP